MAKINKMQASFTAGEISPRLWGRTDIEDYAKGAKLLQNYIVSPYGSISRRPGLKYVATVADSTKNYRLKRFVYSNQQTYMLEFGDTTLRFYTNQGLILSAGTPYSISTPYTSAEVANLRFAQEFDTAFIVHPNHPPYALVRKSDTNWTLTQVTFTEPPYLDVNASATTMTPSGTSGSVTITASAATFASTDVGRAIRIQSGPSTALQVDYPADGTQIYFAIPFYPNLPANVAVGVLDSTGLETAQTYTAGSPTAGQYTVVNGAIKTGSAIASSNRVRVKQANSGSGIWGWATITAYTSSTQVTATVNTPWYGTNATTKWRLGAWSDTTGYPTVATFYEQRLWLGNNSSAPNRLYGSATANLTNFAPDDDSLGTISGQTAVAFALDTPAIQWIQGVRVLLIGAIDGLIEMSGSQGPITATTVFSRKDSKIPSQFAEPCFNATEVQFIELIGKKLHTSYYAFQSGGYITEDLSLKGEHIGSKSPIKQVAYADTPNRIIWALRNDGTLASLTYAPEQQLKGWASHVIGGNTVAVKCIDTIPGANYTELWAVVSRVINGSTVKTVEVMAQEFGDYDDPTSAFFLDSGQTYNGSPATTITGLSRLNGETVQVIADGAAHPDCVVGSGQITLNSAASVVTVGYNSPAIFQSLDLEGGGQFGASSTQNAAIFEIGVNFLNTLGCSEGTDINHLVPIVFTTNLQNMDTAPSLYTGPYTLKYIGGYSNKYGATIVQTQPLPITILNIVYKAKVSDFV